MATYWDKKVEHRCTRKGCDKPTGDDSQLCPRHRVAEATRLRRKRKVRRDKGLCAGCGRRSGRRYRCKVCEAKHEASRAPKSVGVRLGEPPNEEISARTWKDAGNRTRYHGQQTRGRQSNAALDEQDLRHMFDVLAKADNGRRRARAPEMAELSAKDRKNADRGWLSQIDHLRRFAEEVLDRNHYSANITEMVPGESPDQG